MKIIDCKQGSPEWLTARLGVVTASEIDALVSPEGKVRTGAGPQSYLYRKLAEKVLGFPLNDFKSFAMEQGSIVEAEAIPWFSFEHNTNILQCGFCTSDDGRIGFSPDGLIGEDGGIEIKSPQPAQHLGYLLEGMMPKDYVLQVQFSLYVSGRAWWKFVSYSRQLPPLVVHVTPDPKIHAAIAEALAPFSARFDMRLAEIMSMKAAHEGADPRKAEYERQVAEFERTGAIP